MKRTIKSCFTACRVWVWAVLLIVVSATGCKTPPPETALDIRALMSAGNCSEIQSQLSADSLSAESRGALAVCALVTESNDSGKQNALQIVSGDATTCTTAATSMLELSLLHPNATDEYRQALLAVAFGIGGYGPVLSDGIIPPGSDGARMLTVAILRFAEDAYLQQDFAANPDALIGVWRGCQYLLDGNYLAGTDYMAWQLFTALADFALRVFDPFNKTELGYEVMRATVATLEQNGAIGVAARCDLGSPYEKLKSALSKDTALLGPLERAVAVATGCTRGRYAPQPQ